MTFGLMQSKILANLWFCTLLLGNGLDILNLGIHIHMFETELYNATKAWKENETTEQDGSWYGQMYEA